MLLRWSALYARPALVTGWPPLEVRLFVRARSSTDAARLSADVFEQVFGWTPLRAGFTLERVEREGGK